MGTVSFIKPRHKKNRFIRFAILEYFTSNLEKMTNPCVVMAVLACLLASQASAEDFCNGKDNGYYADPSNCIKYYHCFNGVTEEHLICPEENGVQEMYDPEHTWCNYPNKVECGDRPVCDKNDENCDEGTTSKPDPTGTPDFVCPEHSGYFADPKNCIKYYHYYNDVVEEHITCPLDNAGIQEHFAPDRVQCDYPDRVDCGDRPICDENDENCIEPASTVSTITPPTGNPDFDCPSPSGYFADPNNCIKYFHCLEGNVEEHITCPNVNGKQECFDEVNIWCDWPERVNCGNRPICDENDENCNEATTAPTVPTVPTDPTAPTTTPKQDACTKYGTCQLNPDALGPYHSEGPCERCFCQCTAAGRYEEVCCEPGLYFNEKINQCDWPFNIPEC